MIRHFDLQRLVQLRSRGSSNRCLNCHLSGITSCQRVMATFLPTRHPCPVSAESEGSEKNHVRFGDGLRSRAHNGRPTLCSHRHRKGEIPPQIALSPASSGQRSSVCCVPKAMVSSRRDHQGARDRAQNIKKIQQESLWQPQPSSSRYPATKNSSEPQTQSCEFRAFSPSSRIAICRSAHASFF